MIRAIHAALLVLVVVCAGCSDGDDDTESDRDHGKDASAEGGSSTHSGGHKPGLFGDDDGVLELDDAGRPIERDKDGSVAPPDSKDASVTADDASVPVQEPTYEVPTDPGKRGPWAVGVRTLQVDLGSGRLTPAEVWYPAEWQSEAGKPQQVYDLTDFFSPEARAALPESELPVPIACDCYRDLPIDAEHGPYPVAIFVHAWGGARVEATTLAAHWASRGFIAIAADHPQVTVADTWNLLNDSCSGSGINEDLSRTRDVPATLKAAGEAAGEWAFLGDLADLTHVAVAGRILGAEFAAAMSGTPGVRLIMLLSSSIAATAKGDVASIVYVTGKEASVYTDSYAMVKSAFMTASGKWKPTILAGIDGASSQSLTPYCSAKSPSGLDGEHLQDKYMLCNIDFSSTLGQSDCQLGYLSQEKADAIFEYVTTAALEEALKSKDPVAAWAGFQSDWGDLLQAR